MHQAEFAAKEFQKIAEAYEVLSDDELRKVYDEGGSLAEACCKRKLQKSNEVGEDEEDDDDEEVLLRKLAAKENFKSRTKLGKTKKMMMTRRFSCGSLLQKKTSKVERSWGRRRR